MRDRTIPPGRPGIAPSSPEIAPEDAVRPVPVPEAAGPGLKAVASGASRGGLLARLGLTVRDGGRAPSNSPGTVTPLCFSHRSVGNGNASRTAGSGLVSPLLHAPQFDIGAAANAIRRRLPLLDAEDHRRYERMLAAILDTHDTQKHLPLLKMLAGSVIAAARRKQTLGQRSPAWEALTRTTLAVRFDDDVAALSKRREAELLDLGRQLLALPAPVARSYRSVLRDILAEPDLATREALLTRLRRQLAGHLEKS